MTEQQQTIDVLVVGGPVGLMVACELRLAGLSVTVLERRETRTLQSRALTIHGRSLEVLALRGIVDGFTARGRPVPTGIYGALDTRLDFSVFDSTFPYTLFLHQNATEELLEERARQLGVIVRRGQLVIGIDQTDASVIVTVAHGSDQQSRLTCQYVVGADGARSMVRQAAGIEFEGLPTTLTAMLGDVVLDSPPTEPALVISNSAGCLLMVPLGDGVRHRAVVIDHLRTGVPQCEAVTLDELDTATRRVAGRDFGMHDPVWLSRFGNETRIAASYRQGRVLLTDDAAHIHLPIGGQGMNVGLQDAFNLGWKLAAVVRGLAPASLLDSYTAERRAVGQQLHHDTLAQAALVTAREPDTMALREEMDQLLRIPEVNRRMAAQITGFGVSYPSPPLDAPLGWTVAPEVTGRRLPDMALQLETGAGSPATTVSLYSLFHDAKWVELRFRDGEDDGSDVGGERRAAEVPLAFAGWSKRVDVAEVPPQHRHLKQFTAILIRPDGYGAFVQSSAGPATVQ